MELKTLKNVEIIKKLKKIKESTKFQIKNPKNKPNFSKMKMHQFPVISEEFSFNKAPINKKTSSYQKPAELNPYLNQVKFYSYQRAGADKGLSEDQIYKNKLFSALDTQKFLP